MTKSSNHLFESYYLYLKIILDELSDQVSAIYLMCKMLSYLTGLMAKTVKIKPGSSKLGSIIILLFLSWYYLLSKVATGE